MPWLDGRVPLYHDARYARRQKSMVHSGAVLAYVTRGEQPERNRRTCTGQITGSEPERRLMGPHLLFRRKSSEVFHQISGTPLGSLQVLPKDGRAVTTWNNRDEAWTDVARGLRALIRTLHSAPPAEGGLSRVRLVRPVASPGGHRLISFSHINVMGDKVPRWQEVPRDEEDCPFEHRCDRYFVLEDVVYDADLWLDVTVLNSSHTPAILTAVGAEFLDIAQIYDVGGVPQAAKISRPTDEYVLEMPNLRDLLTSPFSMFEERVPISVNRAVRTRLSDPVYLPARAPYRYVLRFKNYEKAIPNHAHLRLLAETEEETAKSQVIHIFTW